MTDFSSELDLAGIVPTSEKLVVFVMAEKGGVGKSFWARGFIEVMRLLGKKVAALDADGQVGHVLQHLGSRHTAGPNKGKLNIEAFDALQNVQMFNVREDAQRDMLVNALDLKADIIVVDMPGGSFEEMGKVLGNQQSVMKGYVAAGFRLVVVIVMNVLQAGARSVSLCVEEFGDTVSYVAVKPRVWGKADEYLIFDGFEDPKTKTFVYGVASRKLKEVGGQVITMPQLQPTTMGIMDIKNLSLAEGAVSDRVFPVDRMRCRGFLEQFAKEFRNTVFTQAAEEKDAQREMLTASPRGAHQKPFANSQASGNMGNMNNVRVIKPFRTELYRRG